MSRLLPVLEMRKVRDVFRDDMFKFTAKEEAFLKSNQVCRLATASKEGRPQVTPVIYALDGTGFVIACRLRHKEAQEREGEPECGARSGQAPPDQSGYGRGDVQGAREGCRVSPAPEPADGQVRGL